MPLTVPAILSNRSRRNTAVKVVRADGVQLGLTDATLPFVFNCLAYSPVSGVSATAIEADLGTAAGNLTFDTLPVSSGIRPEDVRAGGYQDADVWTYELDPTSPGLATMTPAQAAMITGRYRLARMKVGRVKTTITLRETLSLLQQQSGRTVSARCDVLEWGDKRCDPSQTIKAANSFSRTLLSVVTPEVLLFSGDDRVAGFYTRGVIEWTSGANAGLKNTIKLHEALGGGVARLTLSKPMGSVLSGFVPLGGDVATLVRGCDRRFPTCQSIPNVHNTSGTNVENYQGFESVPLPDDAGKIGRQAKS